MKENQEENSTQLLINWLWKWSKFQPSKLRAAVIGTALAGISIPRACHGRDHEPLERYSCGDARADQRTALNVPFPCGVNDSWNRGSHSCQHIINTGHASICFLPGVPIPLHRYTKNVKSLSSTSLSLWLTHSKFPL